MERCPNCSARWDGGVTCRRCEMELVRLLAAERAAECSLVQGIAHLAGGDPEAARLDLSKSLRLQRTPLAELLLGFTRKREQDPADSDHVIQQSADPLERGGLPPLFLEY